MKRKKFSAVLGCIIVLAVLAGFVVPIALADTSITFLNPLGKIEPLANQPLTERTANLEGKTVRLLYYGGANTPSQLVSATLGSMLQAKYSNLTPISAAIGGTMYDARTETQYDTWADGADAVIIGVIEDNIGAWWASYHAKQLEARGVPVVVLTTEWFESAVKCGAEDNGFAGLRYVAFERPTYANAYAKTTTGTPSPRAAYIESIVTGTIFGKVDAALTAPLTAAELSTAPLNAADLGDPGVASFTVTGRNYDAAAQNFTALSMDLGFGDGLPLIIPTRALVDEMLATTYRAGNEVLGKIMLRGGIITVEKVAINAVLAGARPEHFPAILAAIEAYATAWEDGKLFYHATTANEQFTLLMMLSGPIVEELDIGRGRAYDPGKESDALIGRAVRLCIRNIGHAKFENTTAVVGFTRINDHELFVVGESNEMTPAGWKTHSEMMGFPAGSNTITLQTVSQARLTGGVGGSSSLTTLTTMRSQVTSAAGVPTIFAIPRTAAQIAASTDTRPVAEGGFGTAALGLSTKEAVQVYIANTNRNNDGLVWPIVAGFGASTGGRAYNGGTMYGTRGFQTQLIDSVGGAQVPSSPRNLAIAVGYESGEATLYWQAPARGGPVTYQVSCNNGLDWIDIGTSTVHTFEDLNDNVKYIFAVRAVNAAINSAGIGLVGTSYEVVYTASGRGAWATLAATPSAG